MNTQFLKCLSLTFLFMLLAPTLNAAEKQDYIGLASTSDLKFVQMVQCESPSDVDLLKQEFDALQSELSMDSKKPDLEAITKKFKKMKTDCEKLTDIGSHESLQHFHRAIDYEVKKAKESITTNGAIGAGLAIAGVALVAASGPLAPVVLLMGSGATFMTQASSVAIDGQYKEMLATQFDHENGFYTFRVAADAQEEIKKLIKIHAAFSVF